MRSIRLRHVAPFLILGMLMVAWYPRRSQPIVQERWSTTSIESKDTYSFPKWDGRGISIDDVLLFILAAARKLASTVNSEKTRLRFPETLYVLDRHGIWVSFTIRLRTWKMMIEPRLLPTEWMMREGWRVMETERQSSNESVMSQWPTLYKSLYEGDGVPFLTWYGDYKSCNLHNWGNRSIPLFTTAVPVSCQHGFPMPAYNTYVLSKENSNDWKSTMKEYEEKYPWESKIPKVVWRGSLSAVNDDLQSVRWRLCQLATESNATTLDVGLVSIPSRHDHLNLDWNVVGGKVHRIPQTDFQKYTAVLDVDGNSWSSRFGELLCYNSVVLKVEPKFVEYFYKDLEPWKHYIPVKYDLSDLLELSAYAVNPKNREHIQEIVANANEWCARRMVRRELGKDFLDVLETYTKFLGRGDPQWSTKWSEYKTSIYTHEAFDMRRVE